MRLPFVSRARHEDLYERYQLALKATAKARGRADTAHFNRQQVLVQNAALDADNRRLEGRLLELGRRLTRLAEADPEYAAKLEQRVARLRQVGARILAAYGAEKQRADRFASYLDDGDRKAIKVWEQRVKAHDAWTPNADPEKRPIDGASARPTHPAVELRRAQERCRLLQAQIDAYGKRVAS